MKSGGGSKALFTTPITWRCTRHKARVGFYQPSAQAIIPAHAYNTGVPYIVQVPDARLLLETMTQRRRNAARLAIRSILRDRHSMLYILK